jgi:cytoskeletal protein RodZ
MTSAYPETKTLLPKKRRRWLTAVMVLVVFLAGTFVGGAITLKVIVYRVRQAVLHPEQLPANLTKRLTRRLDLDPTQASQVNAVLSTRLDHIQSIRKKVQPDMESEITGLHDDIDKILSPKQQKKWDELYSELTKDWLPAAKPTTLPPTTRP